MPSPDNKDYGELEQSLWRRFQDAEAMPDPNVWSRIDHALAMQDNEKYKKRALFYRQLAAACFILFILAGSALVLHFKQDQENELLAVAKQQHNHGRTAVTGNATITNDHKIGAAQPSESHTLPGGAQENIPVITQMRSADHTYAGNEVAASPKSQNYTAAKRPATPINQPHPTQANKGMVAITDAPNETIAAATQEKTYMPAGQAIVSVPDNYISPAVLNPLLRRNALVGSMAGEVNTTQNINQEKQAEFSVALNKAAESETPEKVSADSRWNMGMAYGSSYFAQNINIPGYAVTSFRIFVNPNPDAPREPSMSMESKENMRDARIEFQENTQAAMSYNVDAKAAFRISKRLKLLTGLGYSQNTSKTNTSYIVEQFVINPRTEQRTKLQPTTVFLPSLYTFTTDSVSVIRTKQPFNVDYSYQMLSVPLGMQVEGNVGQKWYWYAAGSMAANFLMQTTITAANPEIASVTYSATDDSPFRKVQFSGNVGVGVGKRISNAVSVSVGPEYRSFFNSMLTDDKAVATQGRPFTLGLNMGVNYTLGQHNK